MTVATAPERLDEAFALLCEFALANKRCPENHSDVRVRSETLRALAREGRIRVLISGHNWRTVEILTGPHAGKRTQPNPYGSKPHLVIDKNGARRNGKLVIPHEKRQQPSAPRPLTREELR